MVTHSRSSPRRLGQRGALITELVIAISIVACAVLPLALAFLGEQKLCRAYYYRGVAMQVVDGEIEVLRAGLWRALPPGTHEYTPKAEAARRLPKGTFQLTIASNRIHLAWAPEKPDRGGPVTREVPIP